MSSFMEFDHPDRVVVGTIGEPGQRAFFLQASEDGTVVTLKIEKQQVAALAIHLGELLQDLARPGHIDDEGPSELAVFSEPNFIVGGIALAYDVAQDRVLVVVQERERDDGESSEARFALTREQAVALAILGTRLVESGRPPCPLCGYPLDPRGHDCPRTNGHSAPRT